MARSNLSDANNSRDYRIFEGIFYHLLDRCESLIPQKKFKLDNPFYSLDSTVIDLCLATFPWARFRKTKGAMKLHCLLDQRGSIPSFIVVSEGARHDVKVAKESDFPLQPDSIIAFDRAYIDYDFLYDLYSKGMTFVTRANMTQPPRSVVYQACRGESLNRDIKYVLKVKKNEIFVIQNMKKAKK